MEQIRAVRFGAPLVVALAILTTACTSAAGAGVSPAPTTLPDSPLVPVVASEDSAPFAVPDITARPIETDDLAAMLPDGFTGPAASDAPVYSTRSNEELVTNASLDRSDEVADIDRYGRITGVAAAYPSDTSVAHVWIDAFATPDGASGWISDTAGDIVKQIGGSHQPKIDLVLATEYPVDVGEGPFGLILSLDGGTRTETIAMFHIGRIAVFVSVVRDDDGDARVPVQYLAEDVAERVLDVLRVTPPSTGPSSGPPSFDFTFERTVETGDATWHATSSGRVHGSNVACDVTMQHPDLSMNLSLVVVDGMLWTSDARSEFEARGTAGALDRQLLDLCPAWPVDLQRAGLDGVLGSEPATYEIGGVEALGYRGSAEDLSRAVGLDPDSVTVEIFNVWVAEGSAWMIDMDLTLMGEAGGLAQLIGPGFPTETPVRVTMSQNVSSIGSADPVNPPG